MSLKEYDRKRDFSRTPEPSGREAETGPPDGGNGGPDRAGLEYVIQKHDASHLHYDFRLELDGVLKSWAVPKGPSMKPGVKRLAMHVEDHPMDYGGFEGVIPEGQYGGGTVMLWDRGRWIPEDDARKAYRSGRLRFRLEGEKLAGTWSLVRMKPKPGEKKESWLLIKSRDEAARSEEDPDITDARPLSVATGRDLESIAGEADRVWDGRKGEVDAGGRDDGSGDRRSGGRSPASPRLPPIEGAPRAPMPRTPRAQLATLVGEAPEGDDWLHELKLDGYRVLCRVAGGEVRVLTRSGKDWTDRFPGIADPLAGLAADAVVDGEVVVLDDAGVSRFQRLQNSLSGAGDVPPVLFAFDLPYADGRDLTGIPLEDRKEHLAGLVNALGSDRVRYSDHVRGRGPAFFEAACGRGVEGIISKRAGSPYRPGRSRDWLKVKCTARQELVVVGYTDPSGSRVGFGALLLGAHDADGRLVYAGKVGTGFDTATLERLSARLARMERRTPPVVDPPRGAKARGVHWVTPSLVAEIEFTEWTGDGRVRHPSFQGLREDKDPEAVVRETGKPGSAAKAKSNAKSSPKSRSNSKSKSKSKSAADLRVAGVRISSPDRVLWEGQGVTKGELVEYYQAVADTMLERMSDRPLTLVRCPSGADTKCFYQKHAKESIPDVVSRVVVEEADGAEPYMYLDGLASILALVQLGTLEFHVWGSRRDRLERPDRLVFDLDPDEALPFGRVAEAALELRDRLEKLGLESYPKSTGGKGLHVVVPITRRNDWEEARAFTQAVAREMVADAPDAFTAKMTKSRRTGRIFVDYLRNARNATAIAEYSTRARPGAPVAVPLSWDEVDPNAGEAPAFTVRDVPDRVGEVGDPWDGFDTVRQSITAGMKKALGVER